MTLKNCPRKQLSTYKIGVKKFTLKDDLYVINTEKIVKKYQDFLLKNT